MAELRRRYHGSTIHDGRDIGKRRRARVAPATNTLSWLVPLWFVRRGRQMQKICLVSRRATSSDKWLALRPPGRGAYQPPCGGLGAERRRVGSALGWWVVTEKLQLSAARPLHMPPIYSDTRLPELKQTPQRNTRDRDRDRDRRELSKFLVTCLFSSRCISFFFCTPSRSVLFLS